MDSEEDQLGTLIEILTEAKKFGFKSTSSPITPLLECSADLLLLLANCFERKAPVRERLNPELIFPKGEVDVLNNPKILRIKRFIVYPPNKRISRWLREVVETLIRIKRTAGSDFLGPANQKQNSGQEPQSVHYHRRVRGKRDQSFGKENRKR